MIETNSKFRIFLTIVCCLVAIVIITDLAWPGIVKTDIIVDLQLERQDHYNASGNYHYSYKVITINDAFSVQEDFADMAYENKSIEYSVSPLFKEINWYRLTDTKDRSYYSLRIYSGLILPLLVLGMFLISHFSKRNFDLLLIVLNIVLIADLIFLIL